MECTILPIPPSATLLHEASGADQESGVQLVLAMSRCLSEDAGRSGVVKIAVPAIVHRLPRPIPVAILDNRSRSHERGRQALVKKLACRDHALFLLGSGPFRLLRRFWQCPNGKDCKYRHALPPGYVLKSQMKVRRLVAHDG